MNIGKLRYFSDLQSAIDYVVSLDVFAVNYCRIYELSENKPPVLKTNERAVIDQIEKALGI